MIAFFGAAAGGGKMLLSQILSHLGERFESHEKAENANHHQVSKRLDAMETAHRDEVAQWLRLERELLTLKAELPLHYVRREDYIRGQSTLEAKLDGAVSKIDNLKESFTHGN